MRTSQNGVNLNKSFKGLRLSPTNLQRLTRPEPVTFKPIIWIGFFVPTQN